LSRKTFLDELDKLDKLETRSCEARASFDLHISGTPPTFILSQDQTLKKTPTKNTKLLYGDPNPIIEN